MSYQQYYHHQYQYPPTQAPPQPSPVEYRYLFFDLETTGFNKPAITQIAAVGPANMGEFSRYVIPTKQIEYRASELTGLSYDDGVMYKYEAQVNAVPISQALKDFLDFIGNRKVVLIGHNAHRFDGAILRRVAESEGLLGFLQSRIVGVMDTLKIFKEINPYGSNKLESLMERYLGRSGQTHDALDDSRVLQRVVMCAQPPLALQTKHTVCL